LAASATEEASAHIFQLQEMVDDLLALMVGGVCQQLIAADAIKVDGEAASDIMVCVLYASSCPGTKRIMG
jgi:hypothetical protein